MCTCRSAFYKIESARQATQIVLQDVFARLARIQNLPAQLNTSVTDCRPCRFTIADSVINDRERHKATRRRYLGAESKTHHRLHWLWHNSIIDLESA